MITKRWIIKEAISEEVSKDLRHLPQLTRELLFSREIKTAEDAEKFLSPDYDRDMCDSFDILNMDKSVDRILKAIKKNERIVVFGDYDADGVCASVVFNDFFKKIGFDNIHFHIPDRYKDGYGLSLGAINEFIADKTNLIITLDCGVSNKEEVDRANEVGIDVVIIDHHLIPKELPKAFTVIDSKQEEDKYPFKDLAGAGVAFKVVQAIIKKGNFKITPGWEKWLLDVVAIATIADMVPLVGENRTIVSYGLKVLKKTYRPGLISLFKKAKIGQLNIIEDDVGFVIAPRINTAGRMGHASTSFELLTTNSSVVADGLSEHLDGLNNERKTLVVEILKTIEAKLSESEIPAIIVAGHKDWFPGVLGIAANKLMDKYNRPVILWGKGESRVIKGSCRSEGSIELPLLIDLLPKDFFLDFGGHLLAGGFSIEDKNIERLEEEILKAEKKLSKKDTNGNAIFIDKKISVDDVGWKLYSEIEKFQPFGKDNPKPVFGIFGVEIENVKKFGNGGIHLQLDFKQNNGKIVSAIGFFIAEMKRFNKLKTGDKIDIAVILEKSMFRNFPELRLRIVDVK